jgi:hypothetical protein
MPVSPTQATANASREIVTRLASSVAAALPFLPKAGRRKAMTKGATTKAGSTRLILSAS